MNDATDITPWYRSPWPWLLMAPPLAAVLFWSVILTVFATPPSLAVGSYSRVGLTYEENRDAEQAAQALGLSGRLQLDREGGHVALRLDGRATGPDLLTVQFVHPTEQSGDRTTELHRNEAGIYHGELGGPVIGARDVIVGPADDRWRLAARIGRGATGLDLGGARGGE